MSFITDKIDGEKPLIELLEKNYGSLIKAIAQLTLFPPTEIVKKLGSKKVVNAMRYSKSIKTKNKEGEVTKIGNMHYLLDGNCIPDTIFKACFKNIGNNNFFDRDQSNTQLNHIYPSAISQNPEIHSNLAKLCLTPNFIAYLTDKEGVVINLLQFRAYQLYDYNPKGIDFNTKTYDEFINIEWIDCNVNLVNNFKEFCVNINKMNTTDFKKAKECYLHPEIVKELAK